jgi:predicted Zn-dependent protease
MNLLGIALTGKGQLKNADKQFENILRRDPSFVPALKNLGVNEFHLDQLHASERHLKAAAELAPSDPVVHLFLGEIAYRQRAYKEAERQLSDAKPLLFEDSAARAHLAVSYLETNQRSKADDLLQDLKSKSLDRQSQFDLGLALARQNMFRQAATYFDAVWESNRESYELGYNLAICLIESREYSRAIDVLKALRDGDHKTAEVDNLLAEAYEGSHQIQPAIDALREATSLAPDDEKNYLDLATLCIDHQAFDLGIEVLNVGLHYRPESDRLIFERGVLHAMQGKLELAEEDFQLASKLAPDKNFSYIGLGVTYIQSGKLQSAINVLRQRIREQPHDAMLQYLLGRALIQSGANPGAPSFNEAQQAFETSARLDPKLAPPRVELAKVYLRENRVNEAVSQLETARTLDPKNNAVYSQLAIAYRREGKNELSQEMLSSLKELNDQERETIRQQIRIVRQGPPRVQ